MANKMLIDASHPEETRVVVVRGNRIEEFDFESQSKKQLKGNIYLARVTRVEPSLQAAFVEYGGNRHGFLAFSEIHPDYYQIPVADRQALLAAEAEEHEDDEDAEGEKQDNGRRRRRRGGRGRGQATTNGNDDAVAASAEGDVVSEPVEAETGDDAHHHDEDHHDEDHDHDHGDDGNGHDDDNGNGGNGQDDAVDVVGAEDALDELPSRRRTLRRQYKIQEVIKRRQIMLVQVVKEERGNKGAALTTYLSLAGRYSVLMPNTARGGGISRKITSPADRKRLKEIVADLDVPKGMGVILRTAGANRTRAEVKRDYEYLMRLWTRIRDLTLQSTAPALVYEEGSLIKRSVRDLYNKDIDQILVSGEEAYREAKDFMRMLMPSHAKVVQPYREPVPILARNGIEAQLDKMLQPQVTLKSGGYIIINQTEALVAIDVNSGRSTREHSIESTALQTNLEAAEEVARQLRLRDLAGLIVIDFIDMEEKRNNRAVEKKLKECLKNDRARIQVGRISHFGLLEMSRQRLRASVLESTMQPCQACHGTGYVRSQSSLALHVLRGIEEYLIKDSSHDIIVRTPTSTALYVLNHKRSNLTDLENRFGLSIRIEADDSLGTQHYVVVKGELSQRVAVPRPIPPATLQEDEAADEEAEALESAGEAEAAPSAASNGEEGGSRKKRRRRRRRRGGQHRDADGNLVQNAGGDDNGDLSDDDGNDDDADTNGADAHAESSVADEPAAETAETPVSEVAGTAADETVEPPAAVAEEAEAVEQKPARRSRRSRRSRTEEAAADTTDANAGGDAVTGAEAPSTEASEAEAIAAEPEAGTAPAEIDPAEVGPAEAVPAETAEAEPEGKPARKPARKRATAARKPRATRSEAAEPAAADEQAPGSAEAEAAKVDVPVEEEQPASADAAADEQPAKRAPRSTEIASEPVVTSTLAEDAQPEQPKKLGWWRRRGYL